ncbi:MAG: GH13_3 / GH13 [uncultured Frankineae bacterium]|uniref:Alpha-1,4-glucan:maltose-1-phosphate maltosyltransferase n=1 Tax=uncultured Frankineae bacterium TaxID=437475 RepID=A0A6J4MNC8_9ACTN|nr:MAG: GH13_3 / GH13 [uncultured Frankineae bacterium]
MWDLGTVAAMVGRIAITATSPTVSCGQYPARAVTGEEIAVSATVFREGHDAVAADVVVEGPDGARQPFRRLRPGAPGTDRWHASVRVPDDPASEGMWSFHIEAWSDPLGTWWHDAPLKVQAGVDVDVMLEEGARLYERAAQGVPEQSRGVVRSLVDVLRDAGREPLDRMAAATAPDVVALLTEHPIRELVTVDEPRQVWVDRKRALYGAWYEFFPRSEGAAPDGNGVLRSGTFRTAAERLPAVAEMGFDVVYLPPIHPIGKVNRKGPNTAEFPGGQPHDISPDDVGSPWAIGSDEGGHDAIHPELGTIEDFDAFVARTRELGMEVALDFALQCAPDHPWAKEHPEWFTTRADGTIAYAENPPKKYQDIYPLNFDNDPEGLYAECLRVVRYWTSHGVRIFRVDNPHTKPVDFWQWLIREVKSTEPDVLFLAEAFTRPAMMHELAKVGFTQSYTYFTWRTGKTELQDYALELVDAADYMRPNFFVNTPDILHASLQYGGPPVFKIRAVLASLLSPTYGVYAGYELYEHVAVRPGSEEYANSEKYALRPRDWSTPEHTLAPYLTMLNRVRRAHPALQWMRTLTIHDVDNPDVMCFSKSVVAEDGSRDTVIVVVNLDPHGSREATVRLDLPAIGLDWPSRFPVTDEVTGQTFEWGERNYVRLDPFLEPAHILTVHGGQS